MGLIFTILGLILNLYSLVLLARIIFDLATILVRDWRPQGWVLVALNLVYKLTDPPLRFLSRYIPPLRLGAISLDVSFFVLIIALNIVARLLSMLQ